MELHYRTEASVGLLVIVAVVILIMGLMWLKGRSFGIDSPVVAQFETVAGVKVGDPVLVAGVRVGRVRMLELQALGDVRAYLEVEPQWRPRADAWARIVGVGFVGDHAIEYWPGTSAEPLPEEAFVPGIKQSGITELAERLGGRADTLMAGAQTLLSADLAGEISSTLGAARRAMNSVAALGSGPAVGQGMAALREMERLAARLDTTLSNPGLVGGLGNLEGTTVRLNSTLDTLRGVGTGLQTLLKRVEAGEGTLGRLATDTLLYTELRRMTTALADVLEDLQKQPGKYVKISIF
jgi:phospholipid/cholesterol/gamma-HCH transport system substrate-binding protein